MSEYIKRGDVLAILASKGAAWEGYQKVKELTSADVVEQKTGKWEQKEVFDILGNIEQLQSAFCPICKRYHTTPYSYYFKHYNFCPNCGARMVDK